MGLKADLVRKQLLGLENPWDHLLLLESFFGCLTRLELVYFINKLHATTPVNFEDPQPEFLQLTVILNGTMDILQVKMRPNMAFLYGCAYTELVNIEINPFVVIMTKGKEQVLTTKPKGIGSPKSLVLQSKAKPTPPFLSYLESFTLWFHGEFVQQKEAHDTKPQLS